MRQNKSGLSNVLCKQQTEIQREFFKFHSILKTSLAKLTVFRTRCGKRQSLHAVLPAEFCGGYPELDSAWSKVHLPRGPEGSGLSFKKQKAGGGSLPTPVGDAGILQRLDANRATFHCVSCICPPQWCGIINLIQDNCLF